MILGHFSNPISSNSFEAINLELAAFQCLIMSLLNCQTKFWISIQFLKYNTYLIFRIFSSLSVKKINELRTISKFQKLSDSLIEAPIEDQRQV